MKRTKLATALVALTLLAAPAMACMAFLARTEFIQGGVICHYQLSNGQTISIVRPGEYQCPFCLR